MPARPWEHMSCFVKHSLWALASWIAAAETVTEAPVFPAHCFSAAVVWGWGGGEALLPSVLRSLKAPAHHWQLIAAFSKWPVCPFQVTGAHFPTGSQRKWAATHHRTCWGMLLWGAAPGTWGEQADHSRGWPRCFSSSGFCSKGPAAPQSSH